METEARKGKRQRTESTTLPALTNGIARDLNQKPKEQPLTPKENLDHLIQAMGREEKNKQEGGYKRVKCDWFESFEEIQAFNDKKKYQKIKEIGDGTYSRVISAANKETGELVAIKKLYMNKEPMTLSLLREVLCLMTCEHENIVKFIEVLISMSKLRQKKISIVTELCETDLYSLNRKRFPLEREYYKDFFHQMLSGLEYLHSVNIVHRDVKLSNYLLSSEGIVKLGDFGLGKNFSNETEPHSPTVVTLCYRAPELILNDRQYTSAIDIWSLGCCFAELITGKTLFCSPTGEIDQLLKIFAMFGVEGDDQIFQNSTLTFVSKDPSNWKVDLLSGALESEIDILEGCFLYDKKKRSTASQILNHSYWKEEPEMKRYIYANSQDNPAKSRYINSENEEDGEDDFPHDEAWHGTGGRPLFGKRLVFDSDSDSEYESNNESNQNNDKNDFENSFDRFFYLHQDAQFLQQRNKERRQIIQQDVDSEEERYLEEQSQEQEQEEEQYQEEEQDQEEEGYQYLQYQQEEQYQDVKEVNRDDEEQQQQAQEYVKEDNQQHKPLILQNKNG